MKRIISITAAVFIIATVCMVAIIPTGAVTMGPNTYQYYLPLDYAEIWEGNEQWCYELPTYHSGDEDDTPQYTSIKGGLFGESMLGYYQTIFEEDNVEYTSLQMYIDSPLRENIDKIRLYGDYALLDYEINGYDIPIVIECVEDEAIIEYVNISYDCIGLSVIRDEWGNIVEIETEGEVFGYSYENNYTFDPRTNITQYIPFWQAYQDMVDLYDVEQVLVTNIEIDIGFQATHEVSYNDRVAIEITSPKTSNTTESLRRALQENMWTLTEVEVEDVEISFEDFSFVNWITNNMSDLFSIELLPFITLGGILWVIIGVSLLFVILKVFLGG